ncbi:hypothetical protein WA577_000849, partial [Blastocystis sp. JDR]
MRALMNVKEAALMGMAKLKKCVLMGGLKNVKSVKMENAGKLESVKGLKEVVEEERKRREEERKKREEEEEERKRREEERKREERKRREEERRKREEMMALAKTTVSVKCVEDLKNANCYIGVIVVASNCCNERELSVLDLSRFVNLRELRVGDECFDNVKEVKLIGMNQLERVVIGQMCFANDDDDDDDSDDDDDDDDSDDDDNLSRRFYLKNCERLRELKMGRYSFYDYSVCEIENVPSLEVIEMGELDEESSNFYYASLELKNLPSLKSLLFGFCAFDDCSRAVFENLPELTSIRLGSGAFCFDDCDASSELIMR